MTAKLSTHTLNGADGSHAGGVAVRLVNLTTGATLFEAETDDGGRLSRRIDLSGADSADQYELSFATGRYWATRAAPPEGGQIMAEVALRFTMSDPDACYHLPLILSPHATSIWWSVPE